MSHMLKQLRVYGNKRKTHSKFRDTMSESNWRFMLRLRYITMNKTLAR